MKNFLVEAYRIRPIAIIVALLMGAAITSCNKNNDDEKIIDDEKIVISGTLSTGVAKSSSVALGATQKFSGVIQDNNTIDGLLEDGDMIFKLRGLFDPETKVFSMQAASSLFVFSLSGQLTDANAINPTKSQASVQVKGEDGEWITILLYITPGNQTVNGSVNQTDGVEIPAWCRGTWYDQLINTMIVITENAITMFSGDEMQSVTIVELYNNTGGSLEIVARTILFGATPIPYTARFYVANSWNSTLNSAIGSVKLNDLYNSIGGEMGNLTLEQAAGSMDTGAKMFITPYCAPVTNTNIIDVSGITTDGFSPMFETTAAAKLSTNQLKAIPTFFLALMQDKPAGPSVGPQPPRPEPGE